MKPDYCLLLRAARARQSGFTLVEVLVSLIIISVGLLGIAKIQSLAYSSTGTAGARSVAAIEAASLASAMRANRVYWSVANPATNAIALTDLTFTSADGTFQADLNDTDGPPPCLTSDDTTAACTPAQIAAYDLWNWARALKSVLPGSGATLSCQSAAPPMNCTIMVKWSEKLVQANAQGANASVDALARLAGQQSFTLYVEP
jgi:type IV pilus assembly protein PilV